MCGIPPLIRERIAPSHYSAFGAYPPTRLPVAPGRVYTYEKVINTYTWVLLGFWPHLCPPQLQSVIKCRQSLEEGKITCFSSCAVCTQHTYMMGICLMLYLLLCTYWDGPTGARAHGFYYSSFSLSSRAQHAAKGAVYISTLILMLLAK